MTPPRVCPQPEPDCPLYDQRLDGRQDEALRRAILAELRRSGPSLSSLIQAEAVAEIDRRPPLPPLLPKPAASPLPTDHFLKGRQQ